MRFLSIIIMQVLFLGEIAIYMKICYTLWKHDKGMKGKISKNDMQQRKQKNVITLSGQVISFFVEFAVCHRFRIGTCILSR